MSEVWVALIAKDKTKAFNDPQHDICFVEADDKEEALEKITKYKGWTEPWWKKTISRVAILKCFPISELPSHVWAQPQPRQLQLLQDSEELCKSAVVNSRPRRVRRRRRSRSEGDNR